MTLTVGKFDMWENPYADIVTLTKLKYFMSKDLNTKPLKSCNAANNTMRHPEEGTINIVCKHLNQMDLYKTLIKRWIFDDSDEIQNRVPFLYCRNSLEYI